MSSFLKKSGVLADGLMALVGGNIIYALVGSSLIPSEWISGTINEENIWPAVYGQFAQIGMRLGFVLLLGVLIWKWRTGMKFAKASFSTSNKSVLKLVGIGFITFCFASLPWKGIVLINQLIPFGEGLHGWDYLNEVSLSADLVAYILVSALILPPVLEEMFVRGIWLNRIKMQFGPIGAIIITGIIFPLFHGHFYQPDPVIILQLIAFIFASMIWGWVTYKTGSVIPAIVAHALGNSPEPTDPIYMAPIVILMIATVWIFIPSIKSEWKIFKETWLEFRSTVAPSFFAVTGIILLIIPIFFERSFLFVLLVVSAIIIMADVLCERRNSQAKNA